MTCEVEVSWRVVRKERTAGPEETRELAGWLAAQLRMGEAVALVGELAAGKTTFVRGLAGALGYSGRVRSPSFTLMQKYPTDPALIHADLYRLVHEEELIALNLAGYREHGILVVEWADRLGGVWGTADWRIEFAINEETDSSSLRDIVILCSREKNR